MAIKTATRIVLGCVWLSLAVLHALAQGGNQGSITGTIAEANGPVISGAVLSATNVATGTKYTATSGDEGFFRFAILPVGTYEITASKQGFVSAKYFGVEVTIGAKLNLNLSLQPSAIMESVVLQSNVPIVETTRTQLSSSVNERVVAGLPTNGRNFIDFVLLTPGVSKESRPGDITFGGQRGTLNSLTVDGTDNNNNFQGQTLGRTGSGRAPYQFSQDAVQEFQVNTNGYSAELGRAGGAVTNVVTKSGTNSFHGSAFEFFRDRALNANDPIYSMNRAFNLAAGRAAPVKPGYHYNQFGGTLGGPILKDKLF